MMLPRLSLPRFAVLALLALAACGGGSSGPPAEPGVLFAPNFADNDPVKFAGRAPSRYSVQGIDAARFQKSINWNTARRNGVILRF